MKFVGLFCLILAWSHVALGQEEVLSFGGGVSMPTSQPGFAQDHSLPVGDYAPRPVLPYASSSPSSAYTASTASPHPNATVRLEHLLEAAVHLEAAGETEQAHKVRELVAHERDVLQDRLARGKPVSADRQVMVELRVIELSRGRLAERGFDFAVVQGDRFTKPLSPRQFSVIDDSASLLAMLEAMRKDGLVRVLAEPTLVGVSGRPVSFQCGGQVAAVSVGGLGQPVDPQESVFVGTQVDLVPAVAEPDRIRLDMKVTITEPVEARSTESGKQLPEVKTCKIDTGVEMKSGQTCILGGLRQQIGNAKKETVETFILVSSEIVKPPFSGQAQKPAAVMK